ncbi:Na+/H+ antiporter [Terriglobus aquaticus]|uniref:Na+/H+ antiporter n=1 Tax=Terriglobus aquaticus TaxID=940139 RepID=A0ABW9KIU2_9BACT|nr:Na+/H+ antiporter [Terriglobus aquaticus]
MTPIHTLELLLLGLMIAVAVISGVARRLSLSYPIVLVLVGLGASLLPHLPRIPLPPDVVFLVFLPPLLFSAAWSTSWREFKFNLPSIVSLAFGLVFFTAIGVAYTAHHFLPEFDWRMGFLLGAVVSTTDAVAASSVAKKVGMPQRIVDILEGESLLNDATGLLALEFGVAMLTEGSTPTVHDGVLRLLWLLAGGLGVGAAVGMGVAWMERWIDDGPVEIAITIITPYTCYLAGEAIHASGVIAVVTCGLLLSRQSARFFSANTRLQAYSVWEALEFLLNGLVFILLGLQLPAVLEGLGGYGRGKLFLYGAVFSVVLIALRLIYVYPGAAFANRMRRVLHHETTITSPRGVFVIGWTGMRGVVALAAAYSLPYTREYGQPFPQRNLIIFLTFAVILVTLVLQGISLPWLVRALRLREDMSAYCEEGEARRIIMRAAVEHLKQERAQDHENDHTYEDLLHQYSHRLDLISDCGPEVTQGVHLSPLLKILQETTAVERKALLELRDQGRISDPLHRTLERELDLNQSRLMSLSGQTEAV